MQSAMNSSPYSWYYYLTIKVEFTTDDERMSNILKISHLK